ncbi:MAG: SDR family oxidoreductase [Oscillospiraceae bacterium]
MLNNKIALITGASTAIGLATIEKFLGEGATVIATGKKTDEINKFSSNFSFIECDITSEESIKKVCEQVEKEHEKLDCLVTICEKRFRGGVTDINSDEFIEASKHIVMAPILFTKFCNEMLHKSENPSITHDVPMDSYMTEKDFLNSSLNTSVINYTRQCAPQIRPVRINSVLFGIIKGHLRTDEEIAVFETPERLAKIPAGRLGEPMDVANLNAFLASDKARYLNTGAWAVDGGYYTQNPRSMGNNGI